MQLDLDYLIPRLMKKQGWSEEIARGIVQKYKNFLAVMKQKPSFPLVPTPEIDEVWHDHILHTQNYCRDCETLFGKYQHHSPSSDAEAEQQKLANAFVQTALLYQQTFNEPYIIPIPEMPEWLQ